MVEDGAEAEVEEQPSVLSQDEISAALSDLDRSIDGTAVVFTRLSLPGKRAADISAIGLLCNVRYIDLSNNLIKDAGPLNLLDHLLELDIANNFLEELSVGPFLFLQSVDCSNNRLQAFEGLDAPLLRRLVLSKNLLQSVTGFDKNPQLETLNLDNNKIASCAGLGQPSLKEISLANNQIADAAGLDGLTVKALDLSWNNLSSLQGFPTNGVLKSLILTSNKVENIGALAELAALNLAELDLSSNPVAEGLDRIQTYRSLPTLVSLNGAEITDDEKAAAKAAQEAEEAAAAEGTAAEEGTAAAE